MEYINLPGYSYVITDHALEKSLERSVPKDKIIKILTEGDIYYNPVEGKVIRYMDHIAIPLEKESSLYPGKIAIKTFRPTKKIPHTG